MEPPVESPVSRAGQTCFQVLYYSVFRYGGILASTPTSTLIPSPAIETIDNVNVSDNFSVAGDEHLRGAWCALTVVRFEVCRV